MNQKTAQCALTSKFKEINPKIKLCKNARTRTLEDNLIQGVCVNDFSCDFERGGGNELCGKIQSVYSSAALAVNCFAPFKRNLSDLSLLGETGFDSLEFEKKCPTGLCGTPPHLDVVVENEHTVIGIESKLTEHIQGHKANFSESYKKIKDGRKNGKWRKEMCRICRLKNNQEQYKYLDAAQLIKHAFGLLNTYPNKAVSLVYLYWEPANADKCQNFKAHREEIKKLSDKVADDSPSFKAFSYAELWRKWETDAAPDWLKQHIACLRKRYEITVR